jgi:cell division protein FtsI/penicillin-binding protein 2
MSSEAARRRRLLTRALPIALLGLAAFVAGLIRGAEGPDLGTAQAFADSWQRQDMAAMYAQVSPGSAREYSRAEFTDEYDEAQTAATVQSVDVGEVSESDSGGTAAVVPVSLDTHAFGTIAGDVLLPLEGGRVDWAPNLVFPGLNAGERLVRHTAVPERGPILAKNGTPLAEGPATARSSPLGTAATAIAGEVSSPSRKQQPDLERLGFPPEEPTGTSGLELAFNTRLAGHPGGELLAAPEGGGNSADGRVLATSKPIPGKPVHTTIDPDLQQATVAALGATYGGVAVLDADDGSVRAVAGLAFSAPQPPGSTFKLITTTAALEDGIVKVSDQFPVESGTTVEGREIANAHDELCGGSFAESFAHSCNSVFAPLGPEVGSQRLVEAAEAYGFNSPPGLYDEQALEAANIPASTLPKSIPGDLDLAVTAIGQGEVLATPLEMASISQAIADKGIREPTALVTDRALRSDAKPVRVASADVASTIRDLMVGVVTSGTGTAAALPGIQVAGKTGTAELGPVTGSATDQRLDAWFTAFAPANDPKLAVAAMVVNSEGDGGTVAAPIVRQVMASAFGVG